MAKEKQREGGLDEFSLIARYFAPLATQPEALGLRDDAAVIALPAGHELVVSCDTIIEGVHFLKDDPPETIAHKALAVNLSDLAAKGARPYAYLLALALPKEPSAPWLANFAAGLRALQEEAEIMLVGGDTTHTPGPLSLTITVLGLVPQGTSVPRRGANASDRLYVTGTIGDSYLGLRLLQQPDLAKAWTLSKEDIAFLVHRYRNPEPRSALTTVIRNCAESAIDISDGLVGDIEKLCHVSHVNAEIELDRVPLSAQARKAVAKDRNLLKAMIVAGDDYEIAAAVPAPRSAKFEAEAAKAGVEVSAIGVIRSGEGEVTVLAGDGQPITLTHKGFSHF
jgi:thiamine-monophosphate kinase